MLLQFHCLTQIDYSEKQTINIKLLSSRQELKKKGIELDYASDGILGEDRIRSMFGGGLVLQTEVNLLFSEVTWVGNK